jgi:hypothetical protein
MTMRRGRRQESSEECDEKLVATTSDAREDGRLRDGGARARPFHTPHNMMDKTQFTRKDN